MEYCDMDEMMNKINSLPKVQMAIIHAHLTQKILQENENKPYDYILDTVNKLRSNWLYNGKE